MKQLHLDRWAVLIEFQKTTPFTPTLAEIAELWYTEKHAARNTLKILTTNGYAITHANKRYSMYLAIEPKE